MITACEEYENGACIYKDELLAARELISRLDAQIERLGVDLYVFALGPKLIDDVQKSAKAARESIQG